MIYKNQIKKTKTKNKKSKNLVKIMREIKCILECTTTDSNMIKGEVCETDYTRSNGAIGNFLFSLPRKIMQKYINIISIY